MNGATCRLPAASGGQVDLRRSVLDELLATGCSRWPRPVSVPPSRAAPPARTRRRVVKLVEDLGFLVAGRCAGQEKRAGRRSPGWIGPPGPAARSRPPRGSAGRAAAVAACGCSPLASRSRRAHAANACMPDRVELSCWRGSSMIGRPSTPRAWLAQLPPMDLYGALLFQVTGQQLSVLATRRDPGPHRGAVRRPSSLTPPNCWRSIPASSARPGSPGGRSARSATSPSDSRTAG